MTTSQNKIAVGVVGGTGYTGVELLRLLSGHPDVDLVAVTSRSEAGRSVDALFPSLMGQIPLNFTEPTAENLKACDVVFFATPHGVAMQQVPQLLSQGIKVIDLGADFRIKSTQTWSDWYHTEHTCPELLQQAVYGLPEYHRDLIRSATLVANPGCYPTAVQLALMPLLKEKWVDPKTIIADVKSGVSGAGRAAKVGSLLCETSENFSAYAVQGHRHQPEIEQQLSHMAGESVEMVFVPHLTPMIRGIHATVYVDLLDAMKDEEMLKLYRGQYEKEPFVSVLGHGQFPATKSVYGSNQCRISLVQVRPRKWVILSVIDNLVKGAAGQAIQNMNLMYGLHEQAGLSICPIAP